LYPQGRRLFFLILPHGLPEPYRMNKSEWHCARFFIIGLDAQPETTLPERKGEKRKIR
jgi:hypothetical protein